MQDLIGKTVGQYQIVEQIGKGGMATIFKAYQPAIDRYVAIKVLPRELAQDPNFVKRFVHEAKAIAALEHPHILPVHDFGTADDINYMVMRYVKGGTLADIMGTHVSLDRTVKYVANVARALDYAHRSGVVHRDIKPSNILIDEHGEVLLTDFGIAKIMEGSQSTQLTAAGSILGTPAYMSPEQAQGGSIDGRSDIYSLGVVLYELLTGEPPYQGETPYAVVLKHVSDPLPPPRQKNPNVPEDFERIVFRAMAKNPHDRFDTAADMATALEGALITVQTRQANKRTTTAPAAVGIKDMPERTPDRPTKKKNRTQLMMAGGIAMVLACITLCATLFLLSAGSNEDELANQADTSVSSTPDSDETENSTSQQPEESTSPATELSDSDETEDSTSRPSDENDSQGNTGKPDQDAGSESLASDSDEVIVNDGMILFEDSFVDNRYGWPEEYSEDELGYYDVLVEDGSYMFQVGSVSDLGHSVWVEPDYDLTGQFSDFIFSIEATPSPEMGDFLYGMVFRVTETQFYYFEIDNEGYVVGLYTDDEWLDLIEYTYTETGLIRPNGLNELTVEAIGPSLIFFINGEKVAEIMDDTIESGGMGLIADVFKEGGELQVEYDQIQLIEP
jgi:serine/threonine protein kinase